MSNLVIHPTAQLQLQAFKKSLPHALLLSGPIGTGLLTIAMNVATETPSDIIKPKNVKAEIDPNGTIGIEVIRELYDQTRTKTKNKRIIIIDNADRMSHGAQNAFLKLLEEPNQSTFFILTSHHPEMLLPTVRSRAQHLTVPPLNNTQTREFITELGVTDTTKQSQLLFLAEGLPAELSRLVSDDEYFQQNARIIADARTLITANMYQKLRLVHAYRQDRSMCLKLIDSTIAVLRFTLQSKPQISLITQMERLLEAREQIAANQNIGLQLATAML